MARLVLLHASRRVPEDAWGGLWAADACVVVMPGYGDEVPVDFDQDAWEARIHAACGDGAVVVAHSYGGPVAMSAAAARPDLVGGLILIEPAAYALARGVPAIEAHIARLDPVFAEAGAQDAVTFMARFLGAMTGEPADPPATPDALAHAERQRRLSPPWRLRTPPGLGGIPALVLTGGWNDEYEAIASRIPSAEHVVLPGSGHRPQDHPDAAAVVADFLRRVEARG